MKYIFLATLTLLLTATVAVAAYFVGSEQEAIPRSLACGLLAFGVGGGGGYFVIYAAGARRLDLPTAELDDGEVVWAKTPLGVGHYKNGISTGGKLFLTNLVLEFRANPGQGRAYRVMIPLRDIRRARPFRVLGFIPGGLRVERHSGTIEKFHFGPFADLSREWADAIMDFREDLEEESAD